MKIDFEKVFRVGVDKITLHGFEIIQMDENKIFTQKNKDSTYTKVHIDDELFNLFSSIKVFDNGEMRRFQNISFNPNKLLFGHNIHNSREIELKESIKKLDSILRNQNIILDFTNAKITDIEVNQNFDIYFADYYEVWLLFFSQLDDSKTTFGIKKSKKLEDKLKVESFYKDQGSHKVRAYDKTQEVNKPYVFTRKVSRVEFTFRGTTYAYFMKKLGIDNSLEELIKNMQHIDLMFLEFIQKNFFKNVAKFIQNEIKDVSELEYLMFKQKNKLAKATKRKQERNVYKYLDKFWVFDKSFIIEIIARHDKKHKSRETKRINKLLAHRDNLQKFNYLVENFLAPLIPISGDNRNSLNSIQPYLNKEIEEK